MLVYNTIIYPHFSYCISLLISCNKTDISRLQVLQNKCMRTILSCSRYTPISSMLRGLGWITVDQIIARANVTLIYKIENNLMPLYLNEFLVKRSQIHSYPTRKAGDYDVAFTRCAFLQKSLFGDGLRLYNSLPDHIKECSSLRTFVKDVTDLYNNSLNN